MVEVERALRDSFNLYRKNIVLAIPHLIESIINVVLIVSMAITIILAIGVSASDIVFDDPEVFVNQILTTGVSLIAIILLTIFITVVLIYLVKAAGLAGVVKMAHHGFKNEKTNLGIGVEGAKKHTINIFLFWNVLLLIMIVFFVLAFIPAVFLAILGVSEALTVGVSFLTVLMSAVLSVVLYVLFMFAPQYVVVENSGVVESFKKSINFVRQNIGAVLIYTVVAVVFSVVLSIFFVILSLIPELAYNFNFFLGTSLNIFVNLLTFLIGLIVAPYFEIVKVRMIMDE